MQQIFNFLVRFKTGLVFLLLLFVALTFTIESHSYHESKWVSSTNFITGSIYETSNNFKEYIGLRKENNKLAQENASLRSLLLNLKNDSIFNFNSSIIQDTTYQSLPAKVISNSYAKKDNYLLLNKGRKDSIVENMGVIFSFGIVGLVEEVSGNYARVISVLNSNISINAKLKKSNHFGSLVWNGNNPYYTQLIDVPRSAKIQKGDSIVTGGNSLSFPAVIAIGVISNFELNANQGYYDIEVELFNDMTSLGNVYIINFKKQEEAKLLLENKEADE